MRTMMYQDNSLRQGIRFDNQEHLEQQIKEGLQKLINAATEVNVKSMVPECLQIPRVLYYDLDKSIEENGKQSKIVVQQNS